MSTSAYIITKETKSRSVPFYNVSQRKLEELLYFLDTRNRKAPKDTVQPGAKLFIVEVKEEKEEEGDFGEHFQGGVSNTKTLTVYEIKQELVDELTTRLKTMNFLMSLK